jgi:hypothetical protein
MMRALILALLTPAVAVAQTVSCPLTLEEGSIVVARPPAGWLGTSPSLARLTAGGVMRGHPTLMQYLVPNGSRKVKGGSVISWEFDAGDEKWLWCSYGTNALQVAKRMDDPATLCEVTVKEARRGVISEMIAECRAK